MNLLLIMPNFFEYPTFIIDELENLGYNVDFFDDRPSTNPWIKAIIRINKNFINSYIKRYFQNILANIEGKEYDVVFLISGQSLSFSENMIRKIKEMQPKAKFCLYQWDSLANFPYIARMQKYFDKCYTFDPDDAKKVEKLKFLPLFYSRHYEEIGKHKIDSYKYDFCFVGTAHPKKYKFIKQMSKKLLSVFPMQYIYFFFPSKIVFLYRKLTSIELKGARMNEFHYSSLNTQQMDEIYKQTRCVLDSPQEGQKGLTIRVLESVGARKKLITSNKDIVNYDFYDPANIYVYDESTEFNLDAPFFTEDYKQIDEKIYNKYSLRNWLLEILK